MTRRTTQERKAVIHHIYSPEHSKTKLCYF